jgi:hypothetical protein
MLSVGLNGLWMFCRYYFDIYVKDIAVVIVYYPHKTAKGHKKAT